MKNKKFTFFKVINSIILLLVVVVGVFGFLANNQEIKVEAAVKSGYLVNCGGSLTFNSTTGQCIDLGNPIASECELGYSTTSTQFLLCRQKSNLSPGETLRYKVCQNGQSECEFEGNKYSGCNTLGASNSGFVLCSTVSTTTTDNSGKPTTTTTITKTDSKTGITCDITITNYQRVDDKKSNANYALSCTKDKKALSNADKSCIAWVKPRQEQVNANNVGLGCVGGDYVKTAVFNDQSEIVYYDTPNGCMAFHTTSNGSTCITDPEFNEACNVAPILDDIQRFFLGGLTGAIRCTRGTSVNDFKNYDTQGSKYFTNVVSPGTTTKAEGSGILSDECKKAKEDALKADPKAKEFRCGPNKSRVYKIEPDGTVVSPEGTKYNKDGVKVSQTSADGKSTTEKAADAVADLGKFIWQIGAGILAVVLFIFGTIALVVLYFFGAVVLFFLSINPASADAFAVAAQPWGVLVGVGNMMILAAFMYVGFGYLLGVESLKQNLGEFIQKIIYYAILLSFTLSGAATLVNIGYGMGNLIKVGYVGTTSGQELNYALMGNVLNSIGRVSLLRCGDKTADCVIYDNKKGGSPDFFKFPDLGKAFGSPDGAIQSAIREGLALIMAGFAIYVFWRVLKVVLFRFVGIWMIMILSPLGLASYFSPIESWQSLGKNMWGKFLKFVLFYPAFIFALILVNLLSGTFSTKFVKSDSQVAASSGFLESLVSATSVVLGAIVSMTALYYVTKYFADSFDEDMGKIGEAVGKGWESTKKGLGDTFNVAKKGMYGAGIVGRLGNKGIKSLAYANGNKKAYDKMSESFRKNAGLRTVGNLFTGRTLYDLEQKAESAKRVWTGISNTAKKDIERNKGEQDVYNSASVRRALGRVPGMEGILNNVADDPLRGVAPDALTEKLVDDLAVEVGGIKESAVVEGNGKLPSAIVLANLQGMLSKGAVDDDRLKELFEQAVKDEDNEVLQILQNEPLFRNEMKKMYDDLDGEVKSKISEKYGNFLPNDDKIKFNTDAKARNRDYRPSNVEAMDDNFSKNYIESLKDLESRGSTDARQKRISFEQQRANLGDIKKRATKKIHNVDDAKVDDVVKKATGETYSKATKQVEARQKDTTASQADPTKTNAEKFAQDVDKIMGMKESEFNKFVDEHGLKEVHDDLGLHNEKDLTTRKAALKQVIESTNQAGKILNSTPVKNLQTEQKVLQNHANGTAQQDDYKELALAADGLKAELENDFEKAAIAEYERNTAALDSDIQQIIQEQKVQYEEAKEIAIEQKRKRVKASSEKIKQNLKIAATSAAGSAEQQAATEAAKKEASRHLDASQQNHQKVHDNIDNVVNKTGAGWDQNLVSNGQQYANNMQASNPDRVQQIQEQINSAVKAAASQQNEITPESIERFVNPQSNP